MTSTLAPSSGHPIVEFTDRLRRRLGELAKTAAWSMSPEELRAVLVDLRQAGAQLEELRLRVLAAGDKADLAADAVAADPSIPQRAEKHLIAHRLPNGKVQFHRRT